MNLLRTARYPHLALVLALATCTAGCPDDVPPPELALERHGYPNVYAVVPGLRSQVLFPQWTSGHALVVHQDMLLVANESAREVTLLDRASLEVVGHVDLGGIPEQLVVNDDGSVWVALRNTGEVVSFNLNGRKVTTRARLGLRANSLALSVDSQRLYALAPIENELVVLHANTLEEVQRIATASAPTAVAVGGVTGKDLFVVNSLSEVFIYQPDADGLLGDAGTLPLRTGSPTDRDIFPSRVNRLIANRAVAIAVEPTSGSVTVLHVQTTPGVNADLAAIAAGAEVDHNSPPPYYGGVNPADTFNVPTRPIEMLVSHMTSNGVGPVTQRPPVMHPASGEPMTHLISDPRDIVHHPTLTLALVVGEGSDSLLALSTSAQDPMTSPIASATVGAMPRAVACSPDGHFAYVLNGHDYTVSEVDLTPLFNLQTVPAKQPVGVSISGQSVNFDDPHANLPQVGPLTLEQVRIATFGQDSASAAVQRGRRLFHNARNPNLSREGHFSCASCHPNGGEDKLVWVVSHGPRQTPSLAGRLAGTAPFNWNGTRHDIASNMTRTIFRMGGEGLAEDEVADVEAFMMHGLEARPNPNLSPEGMTYQQLWGEQLFFDPTVGCGKCHSGENTTDNGSYNVGTAISAEVLAYNTLAERNAVDVFNPLNFNVPSLRGLYATAPYLHDGSAPTLEDMLKRTSGRMGKTNHLSPEERDALVAYLKTL